VRRILLSQMSRGNLKQIKMKKLITIFGLILYATLILTSCGPSICDCAKSNDPADMEPCMELLRGMSTSEYIEELGKCN